MLARIKQLLAHDVTEHRSKSHDLGEGVEEVSSFSPVKERINIFSTAQDCLTVSIAHTTSDFPCVYRLFLSLFLQFVVV